jgi:hypothetical protein
MITGAARLQPIIMDVRHFPLAICSAKVLPIMWIRGRQETVRFQIKDVINGHKPVSAPVAYIRSRAPAATVIVNPG